MNNMIITIGREYGSGGREIGQRLAKDLEFAYYDTLLLEKSSQESGLSQQIIEQYDERIADKWLSLALTGEMGDTSHLPIPLRAALSQFEAIKKIGERGSAVIVGRCADYVLQEQENVLSVFIHAEIGHRIDRVAKRNHIGKEEARKRIKNTDKQRASYYNYYTDKEWGSPDSYNICLDSGMFGIEETVSVLKICLQLLSEKGGKPE